jgi:hypothetical protein
MQLCLCYSFVLSILNHSVIINEERFGGGHIQWPRICLIAFLRSCCCCTIPLDVLTNAYIGGVKCNSNHQIESHIDVMQILSISSKDALGWCFCLHFVPCCFVVVVCVVAFRVYLWDIRWHCWSIGRIFWCLHVTCQVIQGHVYLGDKSWLELWIDISLQSKKQHIQARKS